MLPIDLLYRGLALDPAAVAVEDDVSSVTYRELVARVEALAAAFQHLAPTPGSRVG